jgi:hypothetical protein
VPSRSRKSITVSMHHKNILWMIGYHKTENSSVLVFPFAARWSLDKNLPGNKNILRMIGYHKTEKSSALVFPFVARWSLDKNLPGKFLLPIYSFQNLHLVVEIAFGFYMILATVGDSSQIFTSLFFLFYNFIIEYPGIFPDYIYLWDTANKFGLSLVR